MTEVKIMEITQSQIQEWFSSPVSKYYFDTVKDAIESYKSKPRYIPRDINGNIITATACALENAHIQGAIEAFEEIINLKGEMIDELDT